MSIIKKIKDIFGTTVTKSLSNRNEDYDKNLITVINIESKDVVEIEIEHDNVRLYLVQYADKNFWGRNNKPKFCLKEFKSYTTLNRCFWERNIAAVICAINTQKKEYECTYNTIENLTVQNIKWDGRYRNLCVAVKYGIQLNLESLDGSGIPQLKNRLKMKEGIGKLLGAFSYDYNGVLKIDAKKIVELISTEEIKKIITDPKTGILTTNSSDITNTASRGNSNLPVPENFVLRNNAERTYTEEYHYTGKPDTKGESFTINNGNFDIFKISVTITGISLNEKGLSDYQKRHNQTHETTNFGF